MIFSVKLNQIFHLMLSLSYQKCAEIGVLFLWPEMGQILFLGFVFLSFFFCYKSMFYVFLLRPLHHFICFFIYPYLSIRYVMCTPIVLNITIILILKLHLLITMMAQVCLCMYVCVCFFFSFQSFV